MITLIHPTTDGRTVTIELNPAIGYRISAENLALLIAEHTPIVTSLYVESSRHGDDATIVLTDGEPLKLDVDAFWRRILPNARSPQWLT